MRKPAIALLGTLLLAACSAGPGEDPAAEGASALHAPDLSPAILPLASQPSIFVRDNGEVDVVNMGSDGSLSYRYAFPGTLWTTAVPQLAGPGSLASPPSIFVRSDGEADIVAQGADNSLWYYWARPGSPFARAQIAPAGTTFSAPAIFVGPGGLATVVAQGPYNSLLAYSATPGSNWYRTQIGGYGLAFSKPSIFVRTTGSVSGETDVVVQGPNNSLNYSYLRPGPGQSWRAGFTVAGAGTTFSAPTLFVRGAGDTIDEADIVARGANDVIAYYHATPGSAWKAESIPFSQTSSAPTIFVRGDGEADVVAQNKYSALVYYYAFPGTGWTGTQITPNGEAASAPSLVVRGPNQPQPSSDNEADIVSEAAFGQLHYYHATPGSGWNDSTLP